MPTHANEVWHLVSVADQATYNAGQINQEDVVNDRAICVESAIAPNPRIFS